MASVKRATIIILQAKHVPASRSVRTLAWALWHELFQTNVTVRVGMNDKHDPVNEQKQKRNEESEGLVVECKG